MAVVVTNNVPRFTIDAWELTTAEREEFYHLNWEAIDRGEESAYFVRYRGTLYCVSEFCRIASPNGNDPNPMTIHPDVNSPLNGWHGYDPSAGFGPCAVIRIVGNSLDSVIMGTYCP